MTVYRKDVVNFESVSQTTLTPSVDLGARRIEGGKEYIYVYNDGGASITSGYGVTVSLLSGYSVTVSSVTQVNHCVGVANTTMPTASYGWIQTKGFVKIKLSANNSMALNDPMKLGTDGLFGVNSVATGNIDIVCGFSVQAVASAGSGTIYLKGLFA
jgi:hypothetical protein